MTEPPEFTSFVYGRELAPSTISLLNSSVATTVNKTCKKNSKSKRVHNGELENQIYGINRGVPNESISV